MKPGANRHILRKLAIGFLLQDGFKDSNYCLKVLIAGIFYQRIDCFLEFSTTQFVMEIEKIRQVDIKGCWDFLKDINSYIGISSLHFTNIFCADICFLPKLFLRKIIQSA